MQTFDLPPLPASAQWSAQIRDAATDEILAEHGSANVVRSASVGKIFLLAEAARQLESGELGSAEQLGWTDDEWVADSGLWYRMATRRLTVLDLAVLIGAVSDNLATNVLLRRVGLDRVQATARELGCRESTLLDRIRNERRPEDPPTLSVGSATELASVMARLHRGEVITTTVSEQVRSWLAANTDLSMVAAAFDLDPLAHDESDRGLRLINKTGTISAARADVGVITGPRRSLAYAVLAEWPSGRDPRDDVLAAMRRIGSELRSQAG